MNKALQIYLETITRKAARLGVHRSTLYYWLRKPEVADRDLVEEDVRSLLEMIGDNEAKTVIRFLRWLHSEGYSCVWRDNDNYGILIRDCPAEVFRKWRKRKRDK